MTRDYEKPFVVYYNHIERPSQEFKSFSEAEKSVRHFFDVKGFHAGVSISYFGIDELAWFSMDQNEKVCCDLTFEGCKYA